MPDPLHRIPAAALLAATLVLAGCAGARVSDVAAIKPAGPAPTRIVVAVSPADATDSREAGVATTIAADLVKRPGFILPGAIAAGTGSLAPLAIGGGLDLAKAVAGGGGLDRRVGRTAEAMVGQLRKYYAAAGWAWPGEKA